MKTIFLEDSNCSRHFYHACVDMLVKQTEFDYCPKKCLPPSWNPYGIYYTSDIPKCETGNETECSWDIIYDIYADISNIDKCPKSCIFEEYTGIIDFKQKKEFLNTTSNTFGIYYRYARPFAVNVNEEYVIYDLIGMIGSTGGTLGLFIGFTFYDIVLKLTSFFDNIINKLK